MAKFWKKLKEIMKKPAAVWTRRILGTILKCLLTILLIGIVTGTLVTCIMVAFVMNKFDNSDAPDIPLTNETSLVYVMDENGEYVEQQWLGGANSIWVDLEEIPPDMQNAVIAIEDERFRSHKGVDWKRTISAFANLVLHFNSTEYGGSTITQQLIKITTQDDDHSIERKITEIMRAIEMERNAASKDDILEAYLNILPMTGNITGVGAGAQTYFGKDLQDCSLAEFAVLASITNNPSVYHPYYHPENVRERQQLVLYKMHQLGYINDEEYLQAIGEEIHYVTENIVKDEDIQSYYTDLLIEDVIAGLMEEYDYSYSYAENVVYHGGLRIYSAENPDIQRRMEAIYADEENFPDNYAEYPEIPQAAIYIMDYQGRCVATVGGRGEKDGNRILMRDTQSARSPGSSMKPVGVYGPALDLDVIHYSTMEKDAAITLPDGSLWPGNYMEPPRSNGNNVLLPYAIQRSLNTVPVRVLQNMGVDQSYDYMTNRFHFTTLVSEGETNDIGYAPLALGALSRGVTCREMAAAYATFGNGGIYHKPLTYYKVEIDGEVILQNDADGEQVIDADSAYVMNRLLQTVVHDGNGTAASLMGEWWGWEVFAKTGTAENNNDVYFAGGTPYYCAASWFGYDNNYELVGDQTSYARILWNKCMKELHKDLSPKNFDAFKADTVERYYCADTGELASEKCTKRALGVYKKDNIPPVCRHGGNYAGNSSVTSSTTGTGTTGNATTGTTAGTTAPTAGVTTPSGEGGTTGTTSPTVAPPDVSLPPPGPEVTQNE